MTSHYKNGTVWKKTTPYINIGGSWKIAKSAWVNLNSEWKSWFLQGGLNDGGFATYDVYNGFNNTVNATAIQSDNKIILGGAFTTFNAVTVNRIVRLNTDGTVDTAFTINMGTGASGTINSLAVQSDGKIIAGGNFATFNGATVDRIVRLNSDGTRDTAFTTNTGTGANNTVNNIAIQPDGKIVLAGNFSGFNGVASNRIIRLNSDGTRDTAFMTNIGTGANTNASAVAIQADGKIILGGFFTTFNAVTVNRIVRLNSDGTMDTAFTTNTGTAAGAEVIAIGIQSDGKIVLGGNFIGWSGVTVNRIVRLNSDGTRDTAFTTNTGTGAGAFVNGIAVQSDGKIIVVGSFTTFNSVTVNRIVRLNSNGTTDTAFTTNTGASASGTINTIAIQSDGKIIAGGAFTTFNNLSVNNLIFLNSDGIWNTAFNISTGAGGTISGIAIQADNKIVLVGAFTTFNNVTANRVIRLNLDGTTDTAFMTNVGTGASFAANSVAIQSDNKILVGGGFTTFNGVTVGNIVRLNSDGTVDTAFTTNAGTAANNSVFAIAIQSDGKIVLGGQLSTFNGVTVGRIVRLNSDGTPDTAFITNTGTGASSTVNGIAIQSDGKIVAVGLFITFNGVTVNRIVRLNSDGTRDTAFTTNTGTGSASSVTSVAIQSDSKILVGGQFSTFNGLTANRIIRLNSDGTRDSAFMTNIGTASSGPVNVITIQSDGKIILGGQITSFNGVTVNNILRLNSNGTRDTAFTNNAGTGTTSVTSAIAIQSDGKIVVGGQFTGFNNINRTRLARIGGDIAQ